VSEQGEGRRGRGPRRGRPVAWDDEHGVGYVPGRVLVRGVAAAERLRRLEDGVEVEPLRDPRELPEEQAVLVADGVRRPVAAVLALRAEGFAAQLDHVLHAHCDPCACAPHPAGWGAAGGGSGDADPYRPNPYRPNPYRPNPYRPNPYRPNAPTSSARPASAPTLPPRVLAGPGAPPSVLVLDTGLAGGTDGAGAENADGQRPAFLAHARIAGPQDVPDAAGGGDGWLDPVAGHGTFIAGIVEQLAPGCAIRVERVIGVLGDVRETDVALALLREALAAPADRPAIISLSFGGAVLDHAWLLEAAVALVQAAGIVVVASAGNDATSVPQLPAALPGVVAVGAVGPDGPAPFTNYGSWVDACAPGVGLVSSFFAAFDGAEPEVNMHDADRFREWAAWSGTSFAAPVVVAALAREMVLRDCPAETAVEAVVRAPELLRLPCLGTVVGL
jgi:hypothetical protein